MKSFLALWVAVLPFMAPACDVCGIFLGIQPNDRTSSVSLLYRYRRLEGTVPGTLSLAKHGGHGTTAAADAHHRELYMVAEARADLWLTERLALLVALPAVNNYSAVNGVVANDVYGIGDPLLLARYMVVNTRCKTLDERTVHRLMIGLGGKVPLGRHDARYNGEVVPHDQQPGSGSWDALCSVEYSVRRGRVGGSCTVIGRRNGADGDEHRMGHGLSTTAEVFRRFDLGDDWKVLPSLGAYHELAGRDAHDGATIEGTGSSTLFTHAGLRVWWRSWGFQGAFQYAMARQLGEQMVPNRERLILGLTHNLKKHNN